MVSHLAIPLKQDSIVTKKSNQFNKAGNVGYISNFYLKSIETTKDIRRLDSQKF